MPSIPASEIRSTISQWNIGRTSTQCETSGLGVSTISLGRGDNGGASPARINTTWARRLSCVFLVFLLCACAITPRESPKVWHAFSFDGWFDGWAKNVDLLAYSYGDQYRMVADQVKEGKQSLGYRSSVNGPMPVGNFLYVKWRLKETGEIFQDTVNLQKLLPGNMFEQRVTFVIDKKQLYVYLITSQTRNPKVPTSLKSYLAQLHVSYELHPNHSIGKD